MTSSSSLTRVLDRVGLLWLPLALYGVFTLLAQHVADGSGNIGRRQSGGRHLIEQRLKEMIVVPVDEQDLDLLAGLAAEPHQPVGVAAGGPGARARREPATGAPTPGCRPAAPARPTNHQPLRRQETADRLHLRACDQPKRHSRP